MGAAGLAAAAPQEQTSVRDRAREALAACGLSQARGAHQIGISNSALSQWLSNKYRGDQAALANKVERWLAARSERAELAQSMPSPPEWVPTPTAARIQAGLSYAQMAGDVAVIYGGAGLGKTVTARRYAATRPNAWLATITPATHALGPSLERAASACGRLAGSRAARMEAELQDRLAGSQGLLILDEAQHLSLQALEGLRSLHDAAGVGLALLGNETIYTRLTGARRTAEFAQLFSRIGKRVRLARPLKGDVEALLAAWELGGSEVRAAALELARRPGALRGLTKTLRLAALFAGNQPLDARHMQAAWRDLGGDVA